MKGLVGRNMNIAFRAAFARSVGRSRRAVSGERTQ